MGIMNVVEDMGRHVDGEPDPTWDEAVAAFEAAAPARLVRPSRQLRVVYRYADGIFTATSPDLTDLKITGRSMYETRRLVREDLDGWLDPGVEVIEHFPRP